MDHEPAWRQQLVDVLIDGVGIIAFLGIIAVIAGFALLQFFPEFAIVRTDWLLRTQINHTCAVSYDEERRLHAPADFWVEFRIDAVGEWEDLPVMHIWAGPSQEVGVKGPALIWFNETGDGRNWVIDFAIPPGRWIQAPRNTTANLSVEDIAAKSMRAEYFDVPMTLTWHCAVSAGTG